MSVLPVLEDHAAQCHLGETAAFLFFVQDVVDVLRGQPKAGGQLRDGKAALPFRVEATVAACPVDSQKLWLMFGANSVIRLVSFSKMRNSLLIETKLCHSVFTFRSMRCSCLLTSSLFFTRNNR